MSNEAKKEHDDKSEPRTVRRTGKAPLLLRGYGLAASVVSRAPADPDSGRWFELELWTDDSQPQGPEQRHCVVVRYCTRWDRELGHEWAEIVPRSEVAAALQAIDPLVQIGGYPIGPQYEEKQQRLMKRMRNAWEHAISDLLELGKVWEFVDSPSPGTGTGGRPGPAKERLYLVLKGAARILESDSGAGLFQALSRASDLGDREQAEAVLKKHFNMKPDGYLYPWTDSQPRRTLIEALELAAEQLVAP